MDALPNRGSPNVFVGNIPYDQSEEQLKEVFSEVGKVVDFRLVFDPDSGKPKGYGFCQYEDPETAASAIRNLHGVNVSGRPLRVDYGGMDPKGMGSSSAHAAPAASAITVPGGSASAWASPSHNSSEIVEGPPPAPGQPATDAIKATLAQMHANQLLDVLSQMRTYSLQAPDQAKSVLTTHPQLAYALLQAMAMVGMGNPASLARLAPDEPFKPPTPTAPGAPPAPPAAAPPAPYAPPAPAGRTWGSTPAAAGYSYAGPTTGSYSTPPVAAAAPAAAPVAPAAPAAPSVDTNQLAPEQQELLQQVLALTPEQIDAMGPDQRATIIALRQQFGA